MAPISLQRYLPCFYSFISPQRYPVCLTKYIASGGCMNVSNCAAATFVAHDIPRPSSCSTHSKICAAHLRISVRLPQPQCCCTFVAESLLSLSLSLSLSISCALAGRFLHFAALYLMPCNCAAFDAWNCHSQCAKTRLQLLAPESGL